MIIYMCKVICVTNRTLCDGNFLLQIEKVCKMGPDAVVLREKDLEESEYEKLAVQVKKICESYGVECILHYFYNTAIKLGCRSFHAPLHILEQMNEYQKKNFDKIGASCHSTEELKKAEQFGCTYVFAGHIFATDCKKGVEPRGIEFLKKMCDSTSIKVYAIGGINKNNINEVLSAGADGYCIMSGFMKNVDQN